MRSGSLSFRGKRKVTSNPSVTSSSFSPLRPWKSSSDLNMRRRQYTNTYGHSHHTDAMFGITDRIANDGMLQCMLIGTTNDDVHLDVVARRLLRCVQNYSPKRGTIVAEEKDTRTRGKSELHHSWRPGMCMGGVRGQVQSTRTIDARLVPDASICLVVFFGVSVGCTRFVYDYGFEISLGHLSQCSDISPAISSVLMYAEKRIQMRIAIAKACQKRFRAFSPRGRTVRVKGMSSGYWNVGV